MSFSHALEAAKDLDLQHVAAVDWSEYYDWNETRVYYSPVARRFFWYSDSGCSCNYYGDGVHSIADFRNGSREDVLRELSQRHSQDSGYQQAVNAIKAVEVEK